MSVLNWFSRKAAPDTSPPTSGLPVEGGETVPPTRKSERAARRELLYTVMRECMMRAGVLSSSYKFKVLSLDSQGRQFMVMVDLDNQPESGTAQLSEIETTVMQAAKTRHGIAVKAVYWRQKEGAAAVAPSRQPVAAKPAAVSAAATPAAIPLRAVPPSAAKAPEDPNEPINAAEVAAFKQALASGTKPVMRPAPDRQGKGPQNYTLLTGFEDTEMHQDGQGKLSSSQHGDLN